MTLFLLDNSKQKKTSYVFLLIKRGFHLIKGHFPPPPPLPFPLPHPTHTPHPSKWTDARIGAREEKKGEKSHLRKRDGASFFVFNMSA